VAKSWSLGDDARGVARRAPVVPSRFDAITAVPGYDPRTAYAAAEGSTDGPASLQPIVKPQLRLSQSALDRLRQRAAGAGGGAEALSAVDGVPHRPPGAQVDLPEVDQALAELLRTDRLLTSASLSDRQALTRPWAARSA
jgi:hypothetical protein